MMSRLSAHSRNISHTRLLGDSHPNHPIHACTLSTRLSRRLPAPRRRDKYLLFKIPAPVSRGSQDKPLVSRGWPTYARVRAASESEREGQKEGLIINRRQQRRFEGATSERNKGEGDAGVRAGAVECAATATAATAVHHEGGLQGERGLYRALLYK